MKHFAFLIPLLLPLLFSCGGPKPEKAAEPTAKAGQEPAKVPAPAAKAPPKPDKAPLTEVDFFLRFYTQGYLGLQQKSAEADWALNTVIVEGDDSNSKAYEKAEGELAEYTGSVEMISKAKRYLEREAALSAADVGIRLWDRATSLPPPILPVPNRMRRGGVQPDVLPNASTAMLAIDGGVGGRTAGSPALCARNRR